MHIENDTAVISKFEVMKAFFLTEKEDDVSMAEELNKMISVFYDHERRTRRNITTLPFEIKAYKRAIDYIKRACV